MLDTSMCLPWNVINYDFRQVLTSSRRDAQGSKNKEGKLVSWQWERIQGFEPEIQICADFGAQVL